MQGDYLNTMEKTIKEITSLSETLIQEYYNNYYENLFSYLDDDIVWTNSKFNEWLVGKADYVMALTLAEFSIDSQFENMKITAQAFGTDIIEVMVSFTVTFKYQDVDFLIKREKLMHITWVKRKEGWRIAILSLVNSGLSDLEEPLFPLHKKEYLSKSEYSYDRRIELIDIHHTSSYVPLGSIIYAESKGQNSEIHTLSSSILVPKTITELHNTVLHNFLRPHISFLINLEYMDRIGRYKLVLLNGKEIPIPEKKYCLVKEQIDKLML